MKKIVVPCDFSKPAINAFRFALDVAAQSKGTIYLLHVIELPLLSDPLMPVLTFDQNLLDDLREKAIRELGKLSFRYNLDLKVSTHVEFGGVAEAIKNFVTEKSADIIIMGTHGATGLHEVFVGSKAAKVVRGSNIPVLVMNHYSKGPIKNIVLPNTLHLDDMEDFTMKVKALQAFFKARLHIVYINTPTNFTSDTVMYPRLKEFAKKFMFKDFTLNIFNHHFEEDGIFEFAKSVKGDVIAMGTHGKNIAQLFRGSLAESIVSHTDSAIWAYNLNAKTQKL